VSDAFMLTGRVAVVTGGASGIGYAIATEFLRAGATVHCIDVDADKLARAVDALGEGAHAYECDVTELDDVVHTFAAIPPVDILANSAGVSHVGNLENTHPDDFDRLFRVNVRGVYLCMQAVVPGMAQRGRGVVLNVASIAATAGLADRFAYSMTKGAVVSMTLSVARDFVQRGVRCNCISPARIHTPFVDDFLARTYPGRESEMFGKLSALQPVGRMGTPEEVASLARFLASDEAAFITGTDYPIDGGFLRLHG
jgi:2-keto-3-deoxy-L-fuconate dehydrogenase